jgi:hypothetical protein
MQTYKKIAAIIKSVVTRVLVGFALEFKTTRTKISRSNARSNGVHQVAINVVKQLSGDIMVDMPNTLDCVRVGVEFAFELVTR